MKGTSTLLLLLSLVLFSWISGGESSSLASSSTPICSTSCFGQKEGSCFTTNDGYCCDCFSGCGGPIPHGLLPKSMDLEAHFSSYFPNLLITVGHKIQVTVSVPSLAQDQISESLRLTSRIRFGDHSTSWGTKCDFPNDPNWSIASTVEESGSVMDIYSNSFDIDKFKGCGLTQGDDSQQYFSTIYVEKNLIFSEGKYNFHRKYFAEKSFNVTIPSFHATVTGGPVLSRKRATASPNDYVAIIGSVEYTGGKWFITLTTQTDSTWLFARIASDAPNALALSTTYGRNLQRFQLPSPTPCTNCQQSTIYTLDGCDAIDGSKPITDRFQLCNNELCTAPTDPFDVVMTVSTSSACTVAKTLPITRSLKIYTNEERTNEYIYASSPSFATTDMIFFRLSITKPPSFNCPTGSVPDYKITNICAYGPPSTQTADASDPGTLCSEIDESHRLGLADYVPKAVSFDGTGGACSDATTIVYDFKVKGDVLKSKAGNTVNNFRVQADAPLDYVVGSSKRNEKEFHQSGSVAMIKVLDVIQETPINQEVVKKNLPQNLKEEETDDSSSNHLWVPLLLIAIALITSF